MGYTYAKQSVVLYLKFKFNWVSYLLNWAGPLSFRCVGSELGLTFHPLYPHPCPHHPVSQAPGPGLVFSEHVAGGRQGK